MDAESGTWDDLLDAGEDRLDISRLDRRRGGGSSSGVAGAAGFARDFAPARPSSASPPKGWDSRERERDGSPAREWPRSPVRDVSGHALPLQVPRPATPPVQRTHQKTSSMASVDDLSASGGSAGSVPRRSDRDRDRDRELSRHDSMEREVRDRRRQDSTDSLHSRSNPNIQLVQETGSDRVLDMSYGKMSHVMRQTLSAPAAQSLRTLYLACNQLPAFPPELLLLTNLKRLDLSFNKLKRLPDEFFLRLSMLEFLDLKSNSLDALPMPPRETQRLRELNLHKNLLTAIPPVFFRSFPALEILDLSCNAFSTFPADQFAHLTRLIRLSLADNAFPAPPVLPTSLQHLDLSYNKTLDRLPWPLPPQLTTLTCTNGILAALHQALFGPSLKLRRLDLSFNAIDRLPDSLATLPDLEYLSLHGNPIRELPWSFAHGPPRLATFVLPWKGFMLPPEPIAKRAAKDTGELRSWLAERMPRERRREEPPRPSHRAPSLDTARAELPPSPTREAREERKPVGASASIAAQIARSRPGSPQKPSPLQIEVGDLRGIRNYAPRSAPVSPDKASPDRRKSTRTGIADM